MDVKIGGGGVVGEFVEVKDEFFLEFVGEFVLGVEEDNVMLWDGDGKFVEEVVWVGGVELFD